MSTTTAPAVTFTFDRDYSNLAQIFPFYPAYLARRAELNAAGKYPYNDSFVGHLGLEPGTKSEDTAIYLCQKLAETHDTAVKVNDFLNAGGTFYTPGMTVPGPRCTIAQFGWYMGNTGFRISKDVRLVFRDGQDRPYMALPRNARTRGYGIEGVLMVKEA